jgi:hypothetical protein
MMRKAETSTARPSQSPTPTSSASEQTEAASNPTPAPQSSQDQPSISMSSFKELDDVQRAVVIDEVTSEVNASAANGEGQSSIDDIAKRVLDILRTKLRLERERNRKF